MNKNYRPVFLAMAYTMMVLVGLRLATGAWVSAAIAGALGIFAHLQAEEERRYH